MQARCEIKQRLKQANTGASQARRRLSKVQHHLKNIQAEPETEKQAQGNGGHGASSRQHARLQDCREAPTLLSATPARPPRFKQRSQGVAPG
eukprot:1084638-Pelagomonas_calceolata.AAC.3